jgi:magnesium transporter
MITAIYRDEAGVLTVEPSQAKLKALVHGGRGCLWVDVQEAEAKGAPLLRDVFEFHPLAIEDCFNERLDIAKVDDYGSYLFIIALTFTYVSRNARGRPLELGLFLGPNYVVSVHEDSMPAIDELVERVSQSGHPLERGPGFMAHSTQLREALLLRRNALRLRHLILTERDIVNRLARGDFPRLVPAEASIFYRDIYDHLVRGELMVDGLRDLADGVLNTYLSAVNNRSNEVMKAMSIVAVIFLPLTLIASIFGTNLDYSLFGAHFEAGFFLMLAVMVAIAAALVVYFRRRGWF